VRFSAPAAGLGDYFQATLWLGLVVAQLVDLVGPVLHYLGSFTQALIAIVDRGDRLLDMLQLEFDGLLGEPWHLDAIDLDALGIEQR
jgi:hypothetical protein